jgi:hypothetical protein
MIKFETKINMSDKSEHAWSGTLDDECGPLTSMWRKLSCFSGMFDFLRCGNATILGGGGVRATMTFV